MQENANDLYMKYIWYIHSFAFIYFDNNKITIKQNDLYIFQFQKFNGIIIDKLLY